MTYRQIKKQLNALFDNVDHSTMDKPIAQEDLEALLEVINQANIENHLLY